jgi:hypothetical protein
MQVTTQDEDIGESEQEELAKEELVVVAKAVELLTVGKGKRKVAPTRAKVYRAVEGPVSDLTSRHPHGLTYLLIVRPMPDVQVTAKMCHHPI